MTASTVLRRFSTGIATLIAPPRCALCDRPRTGLCSECLTGLDPAPDLDPPDGLDRCWALLEHHGATRSLVWAIKFDNRRDCVSDLAALMARMPTRVPEAVTWAPTTAGRRRERGFDQAEVLARGVAERLGCPAVALLTRVGTAQQRGADREQRLQGVDYRATRRRPPAHVLVVDDVRTTGSTLSSAAAVLRDAGASSVDGLTLSVRP